MGFGKVQRLQLFHIRTQKFKKGTSSIRIIVVLSGRLKIRIRENQQLKESEIVWDVEKVILLV